MSARRWFWAVVASAAALRLLFFLCLPYADHGNQSYLEPALGLARDGRYDSFATLHRLPGAPFVFAGVLGATGESLRSAVVVQHLLGVAAIGLLMAAAAAAWGPVAAGTAGALLALHAQLAWQASFLLSETVAQFFFALGLWAAFRVRSRPAGAGWWALAGGALGAAALTRGEFVLIGPLAGAFLLWPGPRRPGVRGAAAFAAAWLALVGGWTLRNRAVFGYAGLTPESATLALDTALPLVRAEDPGEPVTRAVLMEQIEAARTTTGVDPRPTTIERLQREHGWSYLQAELALGRVVRATVLARPLEYLRLASSNFSLRPAPWLDESRQFRGVTLEEGPLAGPWFWLALETLQYWGWLILIIALPWPLAWLSAPGRGRWPALLAAACWASLWGLTLLFRPTAARIQAELYLPLALLAGFTAQTAYERWRGAREPGRAPAAQGARA